MGFIWILAGVLAGEDVRCVRLRMSSIEDLCIYKGSTMTASRSALMCCLTSPP